MTRPRILIVEDQADVRKLIVLSLGHDDYDLVEAADGPSALAACERQPPDVLLLDLMLPGGLDGIEICRQVRQNPQLANARVVLMTAADQAVQRERAAEAGVDAYFPKPFSPKELRDLVTSMLPDGRG